MQSGGEFTILLRDNELMSTRASTSEKALATLTHARLGARSKVEQLIGGLTRLHNDHLYDRRGLDTAMAALRPHGILAVCSSQAGPAFTMLLEDAP